MLHNFIAIFTFFAEIPNSQYLLEKQLVNAKFNNGSKPHKDMKFNELNYPTIRLGVMELKCHQGKDDNKLQKEKYMRKRDSNEVSTMCISIFKL